SRRRHTIFSRDWSSDVCSSDLSRFSSRGASRATSSRSASALERELHAMAEAFGKGESEVAESRFGPRQRALAEAIERVRGLEAEELELSREHAEIRRALAERALGSLGESVKIGERKAVDSAMKGALEAVQKMEGSAVGALDEDI